MKKRIFETLVDLTLIVAIVGIIGLAFSKTAEAGGLRKRVKALERSVERLEGDMITLTDLVTNWPPGHQIWDEIGRLQDEVTYTARRVGWAEENINGLEQQVGAVNDELAALQNTDRQYKMHRIGPGEERTVRTSCKDFQPLAHVGYTLSPGVILREWSPFPTLPRSDPRHDRGVPTGVVATFHNNTPQAQKVHMYLFCQEPES